MQYELVRLVMGSTKALEITEADYDALRNARSSLLELLFAEEKFDVLVQNYIEFESELLAATVAACTDSAADWAWFQKCRGLLNRRLLNVLSAARGYVDHFRHASGVLLGKGTDAATACTARLSHHYDHALGYRVMEALRNYTQHRGFPIHALQFATNRNDSEARNRFKFSVAIFAKTSYLREDNGFKAAVLQELEMLGGRVDIKPFARDYVAALSDAHDQLRTSLAGSVTQWEQTINVAIERYRVRFPDEPTLKGLAAVHVQGNLRTNELPLFSDFIEYRRHLAKKNSSLSRLGLFYISGETVP